MSDDPYLMSDLQRERAEFIGRMAHELGRIAAASGLPMLAYLLEMAGEEAALAQEPGRAPATPRGPGGGRTPRQS